ncbi:MAG: 6-phosphofructokinase [Chloroflexi bacterium RBG_16_63_12]|nr:MAG: 6-phosphofructokinase [Chloroflexi bacterium RBG_16_63_12]
MKAIALMTSGGDAPGMNPCVRAVVRAAIGSGLAVKAIRRGFEGLVNGEFVEMGARDVGSILQKGGTILMTGRFPDFADLKYQRLAVRKLNEANVDALVVVGGEGSMRGGLALHTLGFPVLGIPASIDNDISGTQMSLGVDTALNTIIEAIDKLRDTASSHQRAFIVETMGRECGYLALMAGIIGGAEVVLIPEQETPPEEVAAAISDAYMRGKTHAIIVVAEGATLHASELMKQLDAMNTGFQYRVTILGHIQRGGRPSAFDRLLASRFGVAAVERLLAGEKGVMVGLQGREIETTPLEEVCSKKRYANREYYRMAKTLAK